ncbi:LPXTG cell wall anchor domain-containing protein [Corynebacterium guangdongense]|uniref:LPXTG-motif cell wall-anchored protein n=1 Tax=Corynebacterium guangdongense TaxID=1783348 RepID=A0ABU2A0B0_9CORY|nr:LPXTG cell wall anchor domain-containing protein [Corynebacterium guangdongense]MDR7330614.1 LPXTG-motif cell wall-anchored protein [Corynebacterium guangdongense]
MPTQAIPIKQVPVQQAPVQQAPAKTAPAKQTPAKQTPAKQPKTEVRSLANTGVDSMVALAAVLGLVLALLGGLMLVRRREQ